MKQWLIGISIAGFFVSLLLSMSIYPRRLKERLGRAGVLRWWIGSLIIAAVGMGLAFLFAWPGWYLGKLVGPFTGVSKTTSAAIGACIFGLGGAALSGAPITIFAVRFEHPARREAIERRLSGSSRSRTQ